MYYSYVEIEYVATSFSPAIMDLAVKLLREQVAFSTAIWDSQLPGVDITNIILTLE